MTLRTGSSWRRARKPNGPPINGPPRGGQGSYWMVPSTGIGPEWRHGVVWIAGTARTEYGARDDVAARQSDFPPLMDVDLRGETSGTVVPSASGSAPRAPAMVVREMPVIHDMTLDDLVEPKTPSSASGESEDPETLRLQAMVESAKTALEVQRVREAESLVQLRRAGEGRGSNRSRRSARTAGGANVLIDGLGRIVDYHGPHVEWGEPLVESGGRQGDRASSSADQPTAPLRVIREDELRAGVARLEFETDLRHRQIVGAEVNQAVLVTEMRATEMGDQLVAHLRGQASEVERGLQH